MQNLGSVFQDKCQPEGISALFFLCQFENNKLKYNN